MKNQIKKNGFLLATTLLVFSSVYADQTIVNNYGSAPNTAAPSQSSACNQTSANQAISSYGTNTPPGTYSIKHGDGSSEQIYTTGDKKPYIIDNGCNSPVIQPYVYAQPPIPGPTPTPGPKAGPTPRMR